MVMPACASDDDDDDEIIIHDHMDRLRHFSK